MNVKTLVHQHGSVVITEETFPQPQGPYFPLQGYHYSGLRQSKPLIINCRKTQRAKQLSTLQEENLACVSGSPLGNGLRRKDRTEQQRDVTLKSLNFKGPSQMFTGQHNNSVQLFY